MEGAPVGKSSVTVTFDPNSFGWGQQSKINKKEDPRGARAFGEVYNMKLQEISLPNSSHKLVIAEHSKKGLMVDAYLACTAMGLRWRQQAPKLNLALDLEADWGAEWVTREEFSRWLDGIKVGQVKEENRATIELYRDWHGIAIDKFLADKTPAPMEGTLDFTTAPRELTRLEILQLALQSEEERLQLEEQQATTTDVGTVAEQLINLAKELKGGGDATG